MTCPYRETRIDMCPHEPVEWIVCSARDSPIVTYACHAENCACFGPWGTWRSVVAEIDTILESDAYYDVCAVIDRVAVIQEQIPNDACLVMAIDSLDCHRQSHYHDRGGDLLRVAGRARTTGSGSTSGADYLGGGDRERRD